MTELWAKLPEGFDYGTYDGLILKVRIDVHQNMFIALRNEPIIGPPAGVCFQLNDEQNTFFHIQDSGWQTFAFPIEDAFERGFGLWSEEGELKEWLTNDRATQKVLSMNPILNTAATNSGPGAVSPPRGNQINATYYNLYKQIGFYKGNVPNDPAKLEEYDKICWVWKF
jgi:hypothetical protein